MAHELAARADIRQDADVSIVKLCAGDKLAFPLRTGRHAWVQAAEGEVILNGQALRAGDGAAASEVAQLDLHAASDATLVLFDLRWASTGNRSL